MQKIKRLFIIKNPTHLEVLNFYLEKKDPSENYVILTMDRLAGTESFLDALESDDNLKILKVFILKPIQGQSEYLQVLKNIKTAKGLKDYFNKFDEIIFSNYKTWFQHYLIGKFKVNKLVLLSDGLGILEVPLYRKKSKSLPEVFLPFRGSRFISEKILGIKDILHLNYFSQIHMNIAPSDSLEIFKYTRGEEGVIDEDRIYFIGSPLVELQYLKKSSYISHLKEIQESFPTKSISYFAHRKEIDASLNSYNFLGKIVRNNIPFEKWFENEKVLPKVIVSHISSVLVNLAPVYPNIKFYFVPIEYHLIEDLQFLYRYKSVLEGFKNISEQNFKAWNLETSEKI